MTAALQRELAARVLAKRRLIPFTQRINPRYHAGWVHQDIARRLERFSDDVAKGLSPRLMLLMPPRHGKSELASRMFPAWHLGRQPDHEIIACSYNVSLAMTFSRKVKEVLEDPNYQSVFTARLNPNHQSSEEWGVDGTRGGYVAAGVGGGITGKGCNILIIDDPCVAQGQRVRTKRGLVPIEHVVVGDVVLTHMNRWRRVSAFFDNGIKDVVEVSVSGLKVIVTPEHKVYTSAGWVEAQHAKDIYAEDVSAVWSGVQRQGEQAEVLQRGVSGRVAAFAAKNVRSVRGVVSAAKRLGAEILRRAVRGVVEAGCQAGGLPQLRNTVHDHPGGAKVLLAGVPPHYTGCNPGREKNGGGEHRGARAAQAPSAGTGLGIAAVRAVPRGVLAQAHLPGVLFGPVQERSACPAHEEGWQRQLQAWAGSGRTHQELQAGSIAADTKDRAGVCRVRGDKEASGAPHGREQAQRCSGESGVPLQLVPRAVSQVTGRGRARVYDITVEEDHSFIAEGLVVHNCKNAEEADSADVREKLWNWYGSTAYTRLAPGGGVLVIETWWNDDDLAGRLQNAMAEDPESDQFEVVKYPAVAEHDEWNDPATDEIVRADGVGGIHPEGFTLLRRKGDALHPERYDNLKLARIKKTLPARFWSALYQQNPVPDDGDYFTKNQFRRAAPPAVKGCNVFIAWDFAISEKKQNDYTVGTVCLQDSDDVLHVVEVVRFKSGDAFFIVESILNLSSRWASTGQLLGFEDGQIFRAIEAMLKKRMRERKMYPATQVLKPLTDKLVRARALQGRMQQGMVCFHDTAEWYDVVRAEMLRFPAGLHDDCVDSLAWAAQLAIGKEPPRKPAVKQPASWRDKLKLNGAGASHMCA